MSIGARIKETRKKRKMSADELAKRIGKNRATVYRYENGDIENMPYKVLVPVANALGVSPAYLLTGLEEQEQTDGDKLKAMREQRNLSLSELANDLHISVNDIKDYENNIKQIPSYVASAVARYFGIDQPQPTFHQERFNRMVEAMQGEILSDEEFDKVIDYVKFIVSQRGK